MSKLWAGRTDGETAALADEINNSIGVDCRLQRQDIEGSMAHARMLARQGLITEAEAAQKEKLAKAQEKMQKIEASLAAL